MLTNILLGVLGIVLYTLFKAIPYLKTKDMRDWSVFFWDNVMSWLCAVIVLYFFVVLANYEPSSIDHFFQLFGIQMDFDNEFGYAPLGGLIAMTCKVGVKVTTQ